MKGASEHGFGTRSDKEKRTCCDTGVGLAGDSAGVLAGDSASTEASVEEEEEAADDSGGAAEEVERGTL